MYRCCVSICIYVYFFFFIIFFMGWAVWLSWVGVCVLLCSVVEFNKKKTCRHKICIKCNVKYCKK